MVPAGTGELLLVFTLDILKACSVFYKHVMPVRNDKEHKKLIDLRRNRFLQRLMKRDYPANNREIVPYLVYI